MIDSLDLGDLNIEKIFSSHGNNKEDLIDVIKEFWMLNIHHIGIMLHKDSFELFYDVNITFDNWLLAGQKKLCFTSKFKKVIKNNFNVRSEIGGFGGPGHHHNEGLEDVEID
ncbi:12195_t:CDS:2 [Entrophospora sp. SA101]|nr:2357_t:CDS:2 [Entrophospora sp. SA101]CAJ0872221.1 12195_t:CDS:2 [Entrophospora sp. SA101]